jgi:hypothetical protein
MMKYAAEGTHRVPVFFSLAGLSYKLHSEKQTELRLAGNFQHYSLCSCFQVNKSLNTKALATKIVNKPCLYLASVEDCEKIHSHLDCSK